MSKVEQKYWFKPKRYGWGWGIPATWHGWVVYAVFFAIWLNALAWLMVPYGEQEPPLRNTVAFIAIVVADITALLYLSFKYGEPPKWRWGKKRRATKSSSH